MIILWIAIGTWLLPFAARGLWLIGLPPWRRDEWSLMSTAIAANLLVFCVMQLLMAYFKYLEVSA